MAAVTLQQPPTNNYPLTSDAIDRTSTSDNAAPRRRPKVIRRDTDNILSYYQSEHAGRAYPPSDESTIMRDTSPDSSEYSSDEQDRHAGLPTTAQEAESEHARRPSIPSVDGADRRRLAIVELDSNLQPSLTRKRSQTMNETDTAPAAIFSRRGIHVEGLALVAPPDASPRTYTDLTPPSTAPLSVDRASASMTHQRSMSEAVSAPAGRSRHQHQHKSSRDIGIVGMVPSIAEETLERGMKSSGLKVPVFQTPGESPSSSPGRTPEPSESSTLSPYGADSASSSAMTTPDSEGRDRMVTTPAIGESKDITQPVVGPVVVGVASEAIRRDPTRAATASSSGTSPGAVSASRQAHGSHPSSSRDLSPYLKYEPGLHSTAGPLPPPPQHLFDVDARGSVTPAPPRPPRAYTPLSPLASAGTKQHDIHALRDALQLPQSVSAALASIPLPVSPRPSRSKLRERSSDSRWSSRDKGEAEVSQSLSKARSFHVREGAHPPSTVLNSPAVSSEESYPRKFTTEGHVPTSEPARAPSPIDDSQSSAEHASPPEGGARVVEQRRSGMDLRRNRSWVSLVSSEASHRASPSGGGTEDLPSVSISRSTSTASGFPPTPPLKTFKSSPDAERSSLSSNPLKGALTNLKRFSALPRTPSITSSVNNLSSPHSETPSPLPPPPPSPVRRLPKRKYVDSWPDAMDSKDIPTRRNAVERAAGYAAKINELAVVDCGLTEWLQGRKQAAASGSRTNLVSTSRIVLTPATPSTRTSVIQPRHTSHGSTASEVTFPTRPDAYSATDLSTRPIDVVPTVPPPALPYPSLAQAKGSHSPTRSSTLITSPSRGILPLSSKGSGGFFSSIGRKASVRKDRPLLPPVSGGAKLQSKRSHTASTATRPPVVQITTTPSVPGGPRAVPGRIRRSQTFSATATTAHPVESPPPIPSNAQQSRQSMSRRPSLFARARNTQAPVPPVGPRQVGPTSQVANYVESPEFEEQVDRLADLLPHADRKVLAGYLRRSGQDILAIGQYLEDEKNGTLIY